MRALSFFTVCILFLLACQSNTSTQVTLTDSSAADSVTIDTTTAAKKEATLFKGFYSFGDEVSTFHDCETGKFYWLVDNSKKAVDGYKKTLNTMSYPYETVYAEFEGYLNGKSDKGYAADFENVLVVNRVSKMEQKSFRTACLDYEFIALGNEPFWSVDILPDEQQIVLKDLSVDKVFVFAYEEATVNGITWTYKTDNLDTKDKLTVVITKEKCSDGMSDRTYNYSATVTINGRTLKGCAIKKGDRFDDRP